jgi:hypothetical protein
MVDLHDDSMNCKKRQSCAKTAVVQLCHKHGVGSKRKRCSLKNVLMLFLLTILCFKRYSCITGQLMVSGYLQGKRHLMVQLNFGCLGFFVLKLHSQQSFSLFSLSLPSPTHF